MPQAARGDACVKDAAVSAGALRQQVRSFMPRVRDDLARTVAFRSVCDPRHRPPVDCEKMVDFTNDAFSGAGLDDV
jgi:cysteinylglycine-S-conjugate dipeptidase